MPGTKEGSIKARATMLDKYGANYFASIGSKGGSAPYIGKKGFAANPELARQAGIKGGTISRKKTVV